MVFSAGLHLEKVPLHLWASKSQPETSPKLHSEL